MCYDEQRKDGALGGENAKLKETESSKGRMDIE